MASRLAVGEQVGAFRVRAHLVGNTYRASDGARRVLIEVGPLEGWREAAVQMMRAEQLVASLQHPGVARVVARGTLPDRRPWLASEVPSGLGLYDLIAHRVLPAPETTALVRDIADVLAHAHARGVVHRALTLRSIVLATGERAYPLAIADWGLPVAELGVYGAPELANNGEGDGRVDVYALGVMAFRAVTRKFPGEHAIEHLPGVPAGLATLIAGMLAVDPDDRPTAAEVCALARELLESGDDNPVADAVAEAVANASATPELVAFAEDTEPNPDDIVRASSPRFAKPKWTPAPEIVITSELSPFVSGEIDDKRSKS